MPRVHHAPISSAPAKEDLEVRATLEHPELARYVGVIFRTGKGRLRAAPMLRGATSGYVAVIPADEVVAPVLEYTIEVERIDGRRFSVFATREEMQPVVLLEDRADTRERALLKRLGGRRSVVSVTTEVVRFGRTSGKRAIPCGPNQKTCSEGQMKVPEVDDQFWRVEVGYTYRPLRAVAEFSLRGGVVRGTSLVSQTTIDEQKYKVGLNYGAPSVRFRLADAWHLELGLLTSITEIGFSVGGGSALMIGDPYGTRLTLGFETVGIQKSTYFGTRIWSRLDIVVREWLMVAPVIEVTDMPHADAFGVRLFGDLTFAIWKGLGFSLRGGYQARKSTSGGLGLGGTVSLGF